MSAPLPITTCVLRLQRTTSTSLASKQPTVENHAFLTVAANPLSLFSLLHILPRVYNHSVPADVITWICFEFWKNMWKASLHTWKINSSYFCMCIYTLTHIHNKYTYRQRDVAWPVADICKPGKENMNNVLWNFSLTTTQNSCGILQSLPGHAGSGLEHRVCNEKTVNLCRRLLCPGHDKSFQPQWQLEDLQGLKTAGSAEIKGFQEEENTYLRC